MSPSAFSCEGFNSGGVYDPEISNLRIAKGGSGPQVNELYGDFSSFSDSDLWELPSILPKYMQPELLSGSEVCVDIINNLFLPTSEIWMPQIPNPSDETRARTLDILEPKGSRQQHCSLASLKSLSRHGTGFIRLNETQVTVQRSESWVTRLSSHEIVWIAAERFIKSVSQKPDDHFNHSLYGLSSEEINDIELVDSLLASVEKISTQKFDQAAISLFLCDLLSSNAGNPIQRLVHHFSKALRDRISEDSGKKSALDFKDMKFHSHTNIQYYQKVPFSQIVQFSGVQAIVENIGNSKRIHIIDFSIRCGAQWTVLMAALKSRDSSCLNLLRITAVGCDTKSMQDTGNRLASFAETMKLPFSFKVITVSEILNLNEDHFELDYTEKVVVHSTFFLFILISKPDRLHHLMGLLRIVNPCIMVVAEVESNNNSSCLMNRFVEALFYNSAYFDSLDACMESEDPARAEMELLFGIGIKNIVVAEGEERTVRHVKIDVWRALFGHFGMEEIGLSSFSLHQANEMIKNVPSWGCCTLDTDGKCLIIGWKETPIHSLSVWKFH